MNETTNIANYIILTLSSHSFPDESTYLGRPEAVIIIATEPQKQITINWKIYGIIGKNRDDFTHETALNICLKLENN